MLNKMMITERQRVEDEYKKYSKTGNLYDLWSIFNPMPLYSHQKKEKMLLKLLKPYKNAISSFKILDIGCGHGDLLHQLIMYGANLYNLYGFDIRFDTVKAGKTQYPFLNLINSNAQMLPFQDNTFDIVCLMTCLSSIPDQSTKRNIVKEVDRVLKKGGFIVYYDLKSPRYINNNLKGIPKSELLSLFPNYNITLYSTTLNCGLVKRIINISWLVTEIIEKIKVFNTNYIGIFIKQATSIPKA